MQIKTTWGGQIQMTLKDGDAIHAHISSFVLPLHEFRHLHRLPSRHPQSECDRQSKSNTLSMSDTSPDDIPDGLVEDVEGHLNEFDADEEN